MLDSFLDTPGPKRDSSLAPVAASLPDTVRAASAGDSVRKSLLDSVRMPSPGKTDSVLPVVAKSPKTDSAVAAPTPPANSPFVWLVVRSSAPVGSKITVDGVDAAMDSTGRWVAEVPTDSFRRATGSYDVCMTAGADHLCTKLKPQGFDTLEIAPLKVVVDSVIETRDTIRTVLDTGSVDTSALAMASRGDVLKNSQAGRRVTIRAKRRPPRVLGQERVTIQTIKRLPGLAEPDVMRAVQALPGVVQSSDFSTKIYVRGSSSDQNLILFDNAVVYSPAHFGGLFSTFLTDVTGGLDFYKGGFETKYGNRLASVLLVSSKIGGSTAPDTLSYLEKKLNRWTGVIPAKSDTSVKARGRFVKKTDSTSAVVAALPTDSVTKADSLRSPAQAVAVEPKQIDTLRTHGAVRLTTFSGTVATDGKKGDWSWAVGSRRTWIGAALNAARDAGITNFALDYDFYDNQSSIAWGHDGDTVRASIYQGQDVLSFPPVEVEWGNLDVPVNVRKKLGDNLFFQGTAAYSQFHQRFGFSDIINVYNSVETWNGRAGLVWDPVASHRLDGGYEYNTVNVIFSFDIPVAGQHNREAPGEDIHAAWLQDRWILDPQNTITAGVRGYYYPGLDEVSADPRVSYTWKPNKDWKVDGHWGWYTQYLTSLRFSDQETFNEFWYPTRKPMSPTTQALTSLGVERSNLTDLNLRTSVEGYYKDVRNIPLYFPNQTNSEQKNVGESGGDYFSNSFARLDGWAAGLEWAVNRDEGWLSGGFSYALSYSVLKQQPFHNNLQDTTFDPYWADWDQRNTFKMNGAVNWVGPSKDDALLHDRKSVPTWIKAATTVVFPPMAFMWWWAKADYMRTSFQANYNTGLPMTDYAGYYREHEPGMGTDAANSGDPVYSGRTLTEKDARNSTRKRDYFRLDVTAFDFGRTNRWRVYYTIINVTDRDNLLTVNYDTKTNPPTRNETSQFPFLPLFIGWEYEF